MASAFPTAAGAVETDFFAIGFRRRGRWSGGVRGGKTDRKREAILVGLSAAEVEIKFVGMVIVFRQGPSLLYVCNLFLSGRNGLPKRSSKSTMLWLWAKWNL